MSANTRLIRGLCWMLGAVISFGLWQHSFQAGLFMLAIIQVATLLKRE